MQPPRLIDLLVSRSPSADAIYAELGKWGCLSEKGSANRDLALEGIRMGLEAHRWWRRTDSSITGFNPLPAHFITPLLEHAHYLDPHRMRVMETFCTHAAAADYVLECPQCGGKRLRDEADCPYCAARARGRQ